MVTRRRDPKSLLTVGPHVEEERESKKRQRGERQRERWEQKCEAQLSTIAECDFTCDSSCHLVPSVCSARCLSRASASRAPCLCPSVSQCPEKNARPPHMRAFNKAVAVVFNSSGDDNCGLRDGLLVKATAVRVDFRAVIAAR